METLTRKELRERLAAECRARRWRVPSQKRLKKLRDTEQLPKAIPYYEKGKRGRSWLYDASTVAAYVRAEERRRASGKRVRSWKLTDRKEKAAALRQWLARPEHPVPRELIGETLEDVSKLFQQIAAALYTYVERPVGPLEDDRLDGAHAAIESTLDASGLRDEMRAAAEALLRILIFRDEQGDAEDVDLAELLEPIRQRAGPFTSFSGVSSICEAVSAMPLNELLTRPRQLLDQVTDEELLASTQATAGLFHAIERIANVANVIMEVVTKARGDERLRGDVRLDWFKAITDGARALTTFVQSDLAPSFICASALANVWLFRSDSNRLQGVHVMVNTMGTFASIVEQSSFAAPKLTTDSKA